MILRTGIRTLDTELRRAFTTALTVLFVKRCLLQRRKGIVVRREVNFCLVRLEQTTARGEVKVQLTVALKSEEHRALAERLRKVFAPDQKAIKDNAVTWRCRFVCTAMPAVTEIEFLL